MQDTEHGFNRSRRLFLNKSLVLGSATAATLISPNVWANYATPETDCRRLSMVSLHTGESLETVYWENGQYDQRALAELSHLLRDHRSNESQPADRNLLDLLSALQAKTGNDSRWEIISAFRSQSTNAKLRKNSNGVAKKSFHCLGKAIDVRLPGTALKDLHKAALSLQAGGVGYYPKSGFIHVDTGPVRRW